MPLSTEQQLHWVGLTMLVARGQATPMQFVELEVLQLDNMKTVGRDMLATEQKGQATDANAATRK